LLSAWVFVRLRERLPAGAGRAAGIGIWVLAISALAFAAQGLLPLDPGDLESSASRAHATAWTLWWVALLPATLLLAIGLRGEAACRALVLASVATAVAVLVLALLPLDLLAPAAAQRVVFTAWLGWTVLAAGGHRKAGMP
jgi:hypothetical protein